MRRFLPEAMPLLLLAPGCTGDDKDSGLAPGEPCSVCSLTDESNFSYTSEMNISSVALRAGADATLDWSSLSTDIQGHAAEASDVDKLTLLVMKEATQEEVMLGLAGDTLQQSDITLYMLCEPEEIGTESTCNLSDFGILNSMLEVEDYFIEGTGTWLIALQSDEVQGALSMVFLEPSDDAEESTADVEDSTASLELDLDLQSLSPILVEAGADTTVDWSDLGTDGLGNSLSIHTLDTIYLARYEQDVSGLEAIPFDLWTQADALWTGDVTGMSSATLSDLAGDVDFEGVESGWTWVLALGCSTCTNPVPRYVTILEPI
jgi:hypothetical protein